MVTRKEMSSIMLLAEVRELRSILDAKIEKVYQPARDEIVFRLSHRDFKRKNLVIAVGDRKVLFVDDEKKEMPSSPSTFAMLLRKYLEGCRIAAIRQHDFDRIVEIELKKRFEGNDETYFIIAELFSTGNLVFLDSSRTIIQPLSVARWRDRSIVPKERYVFPPSKPDPLVFSLSDFGRILADSDKNLVKALAVDTNLGGTLAEELCLSASLDKKIKASAVSKEDVAKLFARFEEIKSALMSDAFSPSVIYSGDTIADVAPIDLNLYKDAQKKHVATASEALKLLYEALDEVQPSKIEQKINELSAQLERQQNSLREFEKEAKKERELGDALYSQFGAVERMLADVRALREKEGWPGVEALIGNRYENVELTAMNPSKGTVVIAIQDYGNVDADVRLSVAENANSHYEKAKKMGEKFTSALAAIEETKKKIQAAQDTADEASSTASASNKKKSSWFEEYRWFLTSDGHLVVAGRDAKSNEHVVKKHLKKSDCYVHADIHGASSTVVKNKEGNVSETALVEACIFAAANSKAWSMRLGSADAYWVNSDSVSRQPQSGEFLARGAFVIRGEKHYVRNIELKLAVGRITYEDRERLMCAPVAAIENRTADYVIIRPGDRKKEQVAKELAKRFGVSADDVIKILPPGDCEIAETRKI